MFYDAVTITINDQVGRCGYVGRVVWVCLGEVVCVLREWFGLDGYFWTQGLSVGMQECLERFHRRCADYLNRQVISKSDSPNCEREFATTGTKSRMVEHVGMTSVARAKVKIIMNVYIRSPRICM